jgi:hypothetical protein
VEVAKVTDGKRVTYRLELEFMSDFGFYRLHAHETLVAGEENRKILEDLALKARKFMDLKPLPEKYQEQNLKKHMKN